jgi:hypothetical protein
MSIQIKEERMKKHSWIFAACAAVALAASPASAEDKETLEGTARSVNAGEKSLVVVHEVGSEPEEIKVRVEDAEDMGLVKDGDRVRAEGVREDDGTLLAEKVQVLTPEGEPQASEAQGAETPA